MLQKCFPFAGSLALIGVVVWAGCSSDKATAPSADAGTTETDDASGGEIAEDTGSGADSGPSTTDAGIAITYGTCAAFTTCGGDLKGAWTVSGGCLSADTFAPAKSQCPGLKESDVRIFAIGAVEVTDTKAKRDLTITVTAKIEVPKSCAFGFCDAIPAFIKQGFNGLKFDNATCTDKGAVCDCDVGTRVAENTDDTYTTTPPGILSTEAPPRTFEYCVAGTKSKYRETTEGQSLSFTFELTKK